MQMNQARTLVSAGLALWVLVGCNDYGIHGGRDWQPSSQPDSIGETTAEDEFVQRTVETSDILFVVDNSGSMEEEQQALVDNFSYFIQYLVGSELDYHIGVVTLDDPEDPPIGTLLGNPTYIDPTMNDIETHFMGVISGIQQNPEGTCEVGLEASYRALTPSPTGHLDTHNVGFYREDALLTVVIVSDEDDGSIETADCPTPDAFIYWTEYGPWFETLKGGHGADMLHFAAITGDASTGCSSDWGNAEPGLGYLEVVDYLGNNATFFSICEHDWAPVMTEIGLAAAGLRVAFHLSQVPVAGTLEVFLDPDGGGQSPEVEIFEDPTYQAPYSFVYDLITNSLVFSLETMPPEGATLRVVYDLAETA